MLLRTSRGAQYLTKEAIVAGIAQAPVALGKSIAPKVMKGVARGATTGMRYLGAGIRKAPLLAGAAGGAAFSSFGGASQAAKIQRLRQGQKTLSRSYAPGQKSYLEFLFRR